MPEGGRCSERRKPRESEKPEGMIAVPRASGAARHLRSRARHIAWWHADLHQDVDRQDNYVRCRRPVTPSTMRRQRSKDGTTLSDYNVQKESSVLQDIMKEIPSRRLEWNTDPIETAELEDLIGQTSPCMYSCEEHHAHELAETHRWTVDETHDLTIGCQARGGCKGCVGVPRGSLAERISD